MTQRRSTWHTSLALTLALFIPAAWAQTPTQAEVEMSPDCPPVQHNFGPFDYRTVSAENKVLVEGAHFLPQVENLVKGHRGYLGGDIDYTLRAFPNHPRALLSMMRLAEKEKTKKPLGARAPVHCYFEYGVRYKTDDSSVRTLYGIFLLKQGDQKRAIVQLEEAERLDNSDPNISYNIGLAYLQLKRYDKALEYAHKAYAGGFPLPGLRNALVREGKWKDAPPPAPAPAPDASAPAAASAPAEASAPAAQP